MFKIGGQKVSSRVLWLLLCDAAVIVAAMLVAAVLPELWSTGHFAGFDGFRTILRFTVVVVVCILSLHYNGLYDYQVLRQLSKLFVRLLQALDLLPLSDFESRPKRSSNSCADRDHLHAGRPADHRTHGRAEAAR